MIITIGDYKINPDHLVRLGTDHNSRPYIVMIDGTSLPIFSGTEEQLADDINSAIRRERQRNQGIHMEFTPHGVE